MPNRGPLVELENSHLRRLPAVGCYFRTGTEGTVIPIDEAAKVSTYVQSEPGTNVLTKRRFERGALAAAKGGGPRGALAIAARPPAGTRPRSRRHRPSSVAGGNRRSWTFIGLLVKARPRTSATIVAPSLQPEGS
jgi:hypothetical protein